jgi:hypothetical protein
MLGDEVTPQVSGTAAAPGETLVNFGQRNGLGGVTATTLHLEMVDDRSQFGIGQ